MHKYKGHGKKTTKHTSANISWLRSSLFAFYFMALRHHAGSWPPLTGLRVHTDWIPHTQYDSYRRVMNRTQRHLPGNTQHSQQTNRSAPGGGIQNRNPNK
jgi:hypothetical protein